LTRYIECSKISTKQKVSNFCFQGLVALRTVEKNTSELVCILQT